MSELEITALLDLCSVGLVSRICEQPFWVLLFWCMNMKLEKPWLSNRCCDVEKGTRLWFLADKSLLKLLQMVWLIYVIFLENFEWSILALHYYFMHCSKVSFKEN